MFILGFSGEEVDLSETEGHFEGSLHSGTQESIRPNVVRYREGSFPIPQCFRPWFPPTPHLSFPLLSQQPTGDEGVRVSDLEFYLG